MSAPASRKPGDSKFKQQKLPAWKPILTPRTALPVFYVVGVIFVVFGAVLLSASNAVKEVTVDYTQCVQSLPGQPGQGMPCATLLATDPSFTNNSANARCACQVRINITEDFNSKLFIYYELTNYFQNHRQYVKSRSDSQLRSASTIGISDCAPLYSNNNSYYTPCGLVANSLFNDTIILRHCNDANCMTSSRIDASGVDISWSSDRAIKFKNPPFTNNLCEAPTFVSGLTPPNWPVKTCEIGNTTSNYNPFSPMFNSSGFGYENEDFIVWMRTAALPMFRKLYRRIVDNVPNGMYVLAIDYNYPVTAFNGQKHVVLTTTNWMGGKNQFLGIAYLVVGGLSLVVAIVFTVIVVTGSIKQRKIGDLDYLKWQ